MSVHPGARDVLTWTVERESVTVTEERAATEVVMLLHTLRMLADRLYTVLMTLVEGESFDILEGSGSGEGVEAWRRLHKRWDTLTMGRARGLLREILSPGRAKLVEPLMILIGDGKTQEVLDWTLLRLITVTFQQRSERSTRSLSSRF